MHTWNANKIAGALLIFVALVSSNSPLAQASTAQAGPVAPDRFGKSSSGPRGETYGVGTSTADGRLDVAPESCTTFPPIPSGVLSSDGAFSKEIHTTWISTPCATYYEVWLSTGSATNFTELLGKPSEASWVYFVNDTDIRWFTVFACNSIGCNGEGSADPGGGYASLRPGPFGKSSPVNGASGQPSSVTLQWSSSADATSYEYCYSTTNGSCSGWTSTDLATSVDISGLSQATTYYWQVRAQNVHGPTDAGDGTWWSFTTQIPTDTYQIYGHATAAGATINYTGGFTTTLGDGSYAFTVPWGWSGIVTPSKLGLTFSPASRSYTNVRSNQPGQDYSAIQQFRSSGGYDGWVVESGELTNQGGTLNATSTTFLLGDDAVRNQYRSILSFNTSALPDNALITNVKLKLVRRSVSPSATNPFSILGGLMIDVRKGYFGTFPALQLADFQAAPIRKTVGPFSPKLIGGAYTIGLPSTIYPYINGLATNGGLTQLRLRFRLDDNNDAIANFISLYSGNAAANYRPVLMITYHLP